MTDSLNSVIQIKLKQLHPSGEILSDALNAPITMESEDV